MEPPFSNEEEIVCLNTEGVILYRSRPFLKFGGATTASGSLIPLSFVDDRAGFRLALQHCSRTCNTMQISCIVLEKTGSKLERVAYLHPSPMETDFVCCIFKSPSDKATMNITTEMKDSPNKRFRSTLESIVVVACSCSQRCAQSLNTFM